MAYNKTIAKDKVLAVITNEWISAKTLAFKANVSKGALDYLEKQGFLESKIDIISKKRQIKIMMPNKVKFYRIKQQKEKQVSVEIDGLMPTIEFQSEIFAESIKGIASGYALIEMGAMETNDHYLENIQLLKMHASLMLKTYTKCRRAH